MIAPTWKVQFTQGFQSEVLMLEKAGLGGWLDKLDSLRINPFGSNNIKSLKGQSKAFRLRIGKIRVIFRVLGDSHTVLLMHALLRKEAYANLGARQDVRPMGALDELRSSLEDVRADSLQLPDLFAEDVPELAEMELGQPEPIFLDTAELYLIGVDKPYWPQLAEIASLQDLEEVSLPAAIKARIEDYLTAPAQHHIGKIYQLAGSDQLSAISDQPLSAFAVALDPAQQAIVEKPLEKGPYLVRGGPGTGKTLITVARIHRLYQERVLDNLLGKGKVRVGFVSYTKSLVSSASSMLGYLLPDSSGFKVEFKTLDSIVNSIANNTPLQSYRACKGNEEERLLQQAVQQMRTTLKSQTYLNGLLARRSLAFLAEEIETVILGNGLADQPAYLGFQRVGRKTALQAKERTYIWEIYRAWQNQLKIHRRFTFASRRLNVLRWLDAGTYRAPKYDALFVDELQDLSPVAIRVLAHCVSDLAHLHFCADTAQSIYLKAPSWSGIHPDLRFHRGNSFILERSYRMTQEVARAIAPLRAVAGVEDTGAGVAECIFTGARPQWYWRPLADHARAAAEIAWEIIQEDHIHPGQVAIIAHDNRELGLLKRHLEEADVPVAIVDRNHALDMEARHMHLLTAHAAKGLEFPIVIVPWVVQGTYPHRQALNACKDEAEREEQIESSRRLLYVALSRAARRLYMISDQACPSPFLALLDQDDWDVVTS